LKLKKWLGSVGGSPRNLDTKRQTLVKLLKHFLGLP
jgi:hypothetical protein